MGNSFVLGMDIGGSHITAALVDLEKRTFIEDSIKRSFVNSQEESTVILDAWCQIINKTYKGYEKITKSIGIAMPGPFDYERGISLIKDQDKFKTLYNLNIKEALAKRLCMPASNIRFVNDAVAFLQGEVFSDGTIKANANVLGLTLGTGLGAAVCINGVTKDAALWDSVFLNGIAEDYLSTRWFLKRYSQLSGKTVNGVKELLAIVDTDHFAARVFIEFGHTLAHFLIPVIKKYKSEVVIIGGNISGASGAFFPELMATLKNNNVRSDIKITKLKEHAALIGAASCWN